MEIERWGSDLATRLDGGMVWSGAKETGKVMQPHCKKNIIRGDQAQECGRVLRNDGSCENEHLHEEE